MYPRRHTACCGIRKLSLWRSSSSSTRRGSMDRTTGPKQLVDIYSVIDLIAILPTVALLVCPLFGIVLNVGVPPSDPGFPCLQDLQVLAVYRRPGFLLREHYCPCLEGCTASDDNFYDIFYLFGSFLCR